MKEYIVPLATASVPVFSAIILFFLRRLAHTYDRLYHTMNSKMDRLLELTAKAARAEGVLEEKTRRDAADDDRIRKTLT